MDPSIDIGLVYGACRERVTALVRDLPTARASAPVPACPGWSVHDVVAHLAGTVSDVNAGRLDGVGTDAWTAAQVAGRTDAPLADLLAEWDEGAPQFEEALRLVGGAMANIAVADVWNHEQDLRGALGVEGGRDAAAELCAIDGALARQPVAGAIEAAGLAPLRCVAGTHESASGEGTPGATLTAEPFEVARALVGRRTDAQLRAYRWEGDAEPYVALLASNAPATPLSL
jgi:uncharacterized protein (TIGR03083 family)